MGGQPISQVNVEYFARFLRQLAKPQHMYKLVNQQNAPFFGNTLNEIKLALS